MYNSEMFCFIKDCKQSFMRRRGANRQNAKYSTEFIKFPKDEDLFKKWLKALGVQNESAVKWHDGMYLCIGHFKDEDFIENKNERNETVLVLKNNALPTFLPHPNNSKSKNIQIKSDVTLQPATLKNTREETQNSSILTEKNGIISDVLNQQKNAQDQTVPKDVLNNAVKKFFKDFQAVEDSNENPYQSRYLNYFDPRYMRNVRLEHLADPRKAKVSLHLAKRTLVQQTNRIRKLKNQNKLLSRKLEKLQNLLHYATKPGRHNKRNGDKETITVLVNI